MRCLVYRLGQVEYGAAYRMQRRLRQMRIEGAIPDVLLLLEHPPTVTLGKTGQTKNILVSPDQLRERKIALYFSGRGGDVTYHGPGQLVAYPVLSLKARNRDVHQYVRRLEEVALRTLKGFDIEAERDESHPGVWIGGEEIAAIGLSIKKWITMHGLALNVSPNLAHFSLIHPCGFTERKATSMARVLGCEVPMGPVISGFIRSFSEIFETAMEPGSDTHLRSLYEESVSSLDQVEGS